MKVINDMVLYLDQYSYATTVLIVGVHLPRSLHAYPEIHHEQIENEYVATSVFKYFKFK